MQDSPFVNKPDFPMIGDSGGPAVNTEPVHHPDTTTVPQNPTSPR